MLNVWFKSQFMTECILSMSDDHITFGCLRVSIEPRYQGRAVIRASIDALGPFAKPVQRHANTEKYGCVCVWGRGGEGGPNLVSAGLGLGHQLGLQAVLQQRGAVRRHAQGRRRRRGGSPQHVYSLHDARLQHARQAAPLHRACVPGPLHLCLPSTRITMHVNAAPLFFGMQLLECSC